MPKFPEKRISVYSQYGVEAVDAIRASQLGRADNAVVRRGSDGRIERIYLREFTVGDTNTNPSARGNPQNLVTQSESPTNPPGVWAFKRLLYA